MSFIKPSELQLAVKKVPVLASSTPEAIGHPTMSTPTGDWMETKKSKGAKFTYASTFSDFRWLLLYMLLISMTVLVLNWFSKRWLTNFRDSRPYLPTADIEASLWQIAQKSMAGNSRLSSAQKNARKSSSSCPRDGLSKGHSPGLKNADD